MSDTRTVQFELHRAQQDFCRSRALYRAYIGGRGAGKTTVGAFDVLCRAASEGGTYMIGSPTGPIMTDTTFPTFKGIAERLGLWDAKGVRLSPWPTVTLRTGAVVRFRTAEDPEKMRGPSLSGIWLDEGSLMDKAVYLICLACLREEGRQGWMSMTATPKGCGHWTYEVFGTGRADTECFHSPTAANPFLPPDFAELLKRQYGDGSFARQELGGEWVDDEDSDQVIPSAWVRAAQARWTPDPPRDEPLTCIGADVARGGADCTAVVRRFGPWVSAPRKYHGTQTDDGDKAAGLILRDHDGTAPVNIDAIGLGASAYDAAKRKVGRAAVAVNVAKATQKLDRTRKYRMTNVRALLWWTLREALDPQYGQNIALPPGDEVLTDLTAPRFEVIASGIKVEKKADIKDRLRRSPDVGDAIVLCFTPPKRRFDMWMP